MRRSLLNLLLLLGMGLSTLTVGGWSSTVLAQERNYRRERFETVLQTYEADLRTARQGGDRATEIATLQEAGEAHQYFGRFDTAQGLFDQALDLARQTGDENREVSLLNNLAIVASKQGDYRGINFLESQLAWARQQGSPANLNLVLRELGGAYFTAGNIQKVLEVYEEYLSRIQAQQDLEALHGALQQLSGAYARMGDLETALDYRKQALRLAAENDEFGLGVALAGFFEVAELYERLGQHEDAIGWYSQVYKLANQTGNVYWVQQALEAIGWNYGAMGDFDTGITALQDALSVAENYQESPYASLDRLSLLQARQGQYDLALKFQQDCADYDEATNTDDLGACGLQQLAYVQLRNNQPEAAEKTLQRALVRAEEDLPDPNAVNLEIISVDERNLGNRDLTALTYRFLQQALVEQNRPLEALVVSEESRAQAFIDLLKTRAAVPTAPPDLERIRQIAASQNTTLVQYSLLYDEEPWPAGIYTYAPPYPTEVSQLLIWVVQPSGEIYFRPVKLQDLESGTPTYLAGLVRDSRGGVESRSAFSDRLSDQISDQTSAETSAEANSSQGDRANSSASSRRRPPFRQLHQLLIEPIADLLPTDPNAKVTFLPQGPLYLVPFAALQDNEGNFLLQQHTIVVSPSIQVLDLIEQRQRRGDRSQGPALIVGNPTMPSLRAKLGEPPQPLNTLPGAEIEAQTIAQLLQTEPLLGAQATEATVRQRMTQASIIHLATHGILDNFLGLEAAIAFTPNPGDDGFLTAREVLELKLNADLVVLSACNTGRGEITGDGVVGLSRSFLGAGADAVVASLWEVPDEPTAVLMKAFYEQLQQQAQQQALSSNPVGNLAEVDRAQALRQAMLQTRERFPDPRDWAAFLLIGVAGD